MYIIITIIQKKKNLFKIHSKTYLLYSLLSIYLKISILKKYKTTLFDDIPGTKSVLHRKFALIKSSFTILYFLNKLAQQLQEQLDKLVVEDSSSDEPQPPPEFKILNSIELNSLLNEYLNQTLTMFMQILNWPSTTFNKPTKNYSIDITKLTTIDDQTQLVETLWILFNSFASLKLNLFSILLSLFRTRFDMSMHFGSIKSALPTVPPPPQESSNKLVVETIRNIDDPTSSEEEQRNDDKDDDDNEEDNDKKGGDDGEKKKIKKKKKKKRNIDDDKKEEDADDFLLIGSWFEDQLNNGGETNKPTTTSGGVELYSSKSAGSQVSLMQTLSLDATAGLDPVGFRNVVESVRL